MSYADQSRRSDANPSAGEMNAGPSPRLEDKLFSAGSSVAARLNPLIRRYGYELIHRAGRHPWSYRLNAPILPEPFNTVSKSEVSLRMEGSQPFEVPVDHCTTRYLFAYSPEGWHPLVEALRLAEHGQPHMEQFLSEFYTRFKPKTIQDVFVRHGAKMPQVGKWPATPEIIGRLWNLSPWLLRRRLAEACQSPIGESASVYMGPKSSSGVREAVSRLYSLYESVQTHGYCPSGKGHRIAGFFLVDGSDFRFVLCSGNHRVAVLRHLGFSHCTATFMPGFPYAVNREQLYRWTVDNGGVYQPGVAELLFCAYFSESGRGTAKKIGMMEV